VTPFISFDFLLEQPQVTVSVLARWGESSETAWTYDSFTVIFLASS